MKINIHVLCAALILSIVISIGILGYVPPVDRDSLTHHLYVPKLYLKHGGIYEIPAVEFSYFPMNLDLLYTVALYLGSDILPKYLHFAFALLTAWLIFRYLKYRLNTLYAQFGVLLFLSIPIIVKLSITAYVDLGLIFFSLFSIIYLLKWVENDFRLKYLVISAVGCGMGLGTKYNGLITLFLLTLLVPFSYARMSSGGKNSFLRPLGYCAVYLCVSLVVFSPWMIRNIVWKQNPVYPLYDSWFHPEAPKSFSESLADDSDRAPRRMGHFLIRKYVFNEPWWRTALIPIRIFFEGQDDEPANFDGRLNPLIFLLPFFAFSRIRNNAKPFQYEISTFLAFSVFFLLYAFVTTDMRIRYIAPIVPPLVILSIIGLHNMLGWIREFAPHRGRIWIQTGVWAGVLALIPANYLIGQFDKVKAISYISGKIDRDSYITQFRPEYPAIRFANQNLPDTVKILAVCLGNRGYYFDRDVLFDMKLPIPPIDNTGSGPTVEALLHQRGITHLLIRYDLFDKWLGALTDNDKETLARFFQTRTRLLFASGGHGLFAIDVIITGVEVQPELAELAAQNVEANGLKDRIKIICADMRSLSIQAVSGPVDIVISNPPYRKGRSGRINSHPQRAVVRHEILATLQDVAEAAARLLGIGGRFAIIYPAERITDILTNLRSAGIEPKHIQTVHAKCDDPAMFWYPASREAALAPLSTNHL